MFDALLTCVGSFQGTDGLRHVAGKGESLLFCLVGDCEVDIARQFAVNLYEVCAALLEGLHGGPALPGVRCNQSAARGWLWAVNHGAGRHNPRAG